MFMIEYRQVRMRADTVRILEKLKVIQRESFDSVVMRLIQKRSKHK